MSVGGIKGGGSSSKTSGVKGGGKKGGGSVSSVKSSPSIAPITATERDTLEVSHHQQTLDVIRNLVAQAPEVRVDEVDRIVNQLKQGKYKINFEKVAEGFIKDAILNEMSKRTRST